MRFVLEEFQSTAAAEVARKTRKAQRDYADDGDLTAIGLTAPTGAGKTVIATAVLESLFFGDERNEPDPDLTVLWITDDRNLNRQTIAKITQASDRIDMHHIGLLGEDDASTLAPGRIHFVHIQQLQRNSTLHAVRDGQRSDHRTHGVWEMIANTKRLRGDRFVVVVDEAHRGASTQRDRGTIVGTLVNGGTTNIGTAHPPAPVVLGISATPERFEQAMNHAGRDLKRVPVAAADVRASGLLKDRILITPLAEDQTATHTMLKLAIEDLRAFDEAWADRHARHGGRKVEPILVVQVEPAVSDATLDSYLSTIETEWPRLTDLAVAHSFGDPHGPIRVGDRTIRYLAPDAIEGDDRVRVVLFKSALTTGWDCPRAEVLVSFQSRESYTEIAQLIGRLVRTPLAGRANDVELLDSVVAYLPGFRLEHVTRVVTALTSDETVESEVVIEPATCRRAAHDDAAALLGSLVSYKRDALEATTATARLMLLAFELTGAAVQVQAKKIAQDMIVAEVDKQSVLRSSELESAARDLLTIDLGQVEVHFGEVVMQSSGLRRVRASERDVDLLFAKATRQLPDASAAWLYRAAVEAGLSDQDAKARVAAMAALGLRDVIEAEAESLIGIWRRTHGNTVSRLPREQAQRIQALWDLSARGMVASVVTVPDVRREPTVRIDAGQPVPLPWWDKHLLSAPEGEHTGLFPAAVTSWEREVLEAELAQPNLETWYRNPPGGAHALAVPYVMGDETRLMHPDFLFVYADGDDLVVDIVDPHLHNQSDAGPKWAGLARYAARHPEGLRRVVAVIKDGSGRLRALDLRAEGVAEALDLATDQARVESLFDELASDY